jgi:hypothetical protein
MDATVNLPGDVNAVIPRAISRIPRNRLPQSLLCPRMEPAGNPPKMWRIPRVKIRMPARIVNVDRANRLVSNGQLKATKLPRMVKIPNINIKGFSFASSLALMRYVTPIISQNKARNLTKRWILCWPFMSRRRASNIVLSPQIRFTDQCLNILTLTLNQTFAHSTIITDLINNKCV